MLGASFKIYNASAGSGKTYTLTREYLKIALSPSKSFKRILAITFTNKAVSEMKNRILESLLNFSRTKDLKQASPLFLDVMSDLQLEVENLRNLSKLTLKEILHNYAFFDISTIDKFTHRLIRTFARDLKLPQNFEVVLDNDILLDEAVNRLIGKTGEDVQLTEVLIEFALEKTDDNKSWDIAFDLKRMGALLFNETDNTHIKNLENKTLEDFGALKKHIRSEIKSLGRKAVLLANETLDMIKVYGLEDHAFPRETLPNHFKKISASEFDPYKLYHNRLEDHLLEGKILKSGFQLPSNEIPTKLLISYRGIKEIVYQRAFLKNVYLNIVPLTVLNAIDREVRSIQIERDQLSISEFNSIISREIKNQPAPFIYERLGEKYRHYFIDEFQDTSEMQWNNLIPLIDSALSSEGGSLFLVGDAKQAIYRWRGGKAEQFLNLANLTANPFVITPTIESLPKNYRSFQEIVKFNNSFFKSTSPFLNKEKYNALFEEGNKQQCNSQIGGLVKITFLEKHESQGIDELYCHKVLEHLEELLEKKYRFADICILTRKRKHGILLADFLMRQNIPIVSSETLLLAKNRKVDFLVNLLSYANQPKDLETGYQILYFLAGDGVGAHSFISEHLENPTSLLREAYDFNWEELNRLSVYDGMEYAIRQFRLAEKSDAYIVNLLDFALETELREGGGISAFLSHWEKKKEKLSITAPATYNAVQIMTVHKAKGLEFPIVIFPYANTYIYEEIDPKIWFPVKKDSFNGFSEFLIGKKKEMTEYGEMGTTLFHEEQHKLELDAFNILYVALTRAIKGLYIISEKDINSKGDHRTDRYSGLFIHYLKEKGAWQENGLQYLFGSLPLPTSKDRSEHMTENVPYFYSHKDRKGFRVLAKSGMLWDTEREAAILRGNLIHYILGNIETQEDLEVTFDHLIQNGDIERDETKFLREMVQKIINHPQLISYYGQGNVVMNEKDIVSKDGTILRPDRVVLKDNKATIIDYKTGKKNSKYHEQLYRYADSLELMGYVIENKIIVYLEKEVTLEFI
ncbi:exodeoxyribonuclease V subunit beta [Ulvibacterium sp.]|uniref:UvrD-helicase domain-containing protein n=1 Tax=Ulvibacterium sp. TaxID=2665914 RepID=UPI0026126000|nr:UvrD-helicase domain-containing protein [Ulvibacterium sp.]